MIDGIAGRSTSYEYDLAGRNVASTVTDTTEYDLVASGTTSYADGTGLVDKQTTTIYGANNTVAKHLTYSYGYGTPTSSAGPEAISGLAVNGEQYLYSYDTLGRLVTRKTSIGAEDESLSIYQQTNTGKREEYTYADSKVSGATTTLVKSFRDMLGVLHTYEYDGNGNITSETIGDVNSPNAVKTYKYDEQNRLTRYNDSELNTTIIYTYDSRGNITNYTLYEYAADESDVDESTADSYGFAYNNSTWKDLATSIFDEAISYDTIGNPLNWYTGATFTWENGRQLKSVNKNGSGTTYMYNGDGLRTEKWGDRTTQYIILDGTYLGEKTTFYGGTTYLITYIYGAEGSVIGIEVNGTSYYFVKNLQGDVTSIIDVNGNVVVNYTYDAYGYIMSITDGNGNEVTSDTHIANLNPFRYRGYFYDQETGFYYLRTRYYDPTVCRFLNADAYISIGLGFDGFNMFVYCLNCPIMFSDTNGKCPEDFIGPCPGRERCSYYKELESQVETIKPLLNGMFSSSLPYYGDPGSSATLPNPDGTPKQKRWYGPDGTPERDRDYNHPGDDIPFPHDHEWIDGVRGEEHLDPSPEYKFSIEPIIGAGMIVFCVVGIVAVALDDATVIGVSDDFLFGPLSYGLKEGFVMVFN